jgi:hypothetical protein
VTITTIPPNVASASNCAHDFDDDHLVVRDQEWNRINDDRRRMRKDLEDLESALADQLACRCFNISGEHPWGPWHSRPWTAIGHSDQQQWSRTCLRCGMREVSDMAIPGAIEHGQTPRMGDLS